MDIPAKATRREWVGLAVLALACLLCYPAGAVLCLGGWGPGMSEAVPENACQPLGDRPRGGA